MKEKYTLAECELKHKCKVARALAQQITDINSDVSFDDVKKVTDEETYTLTRYYFTGYWKKSGEDIHKNSEIISAWNVFENAKYFCNYDEDYFDYFVDIYYPRMCNGDQPIDKETYDFIKDSTIAKDVATYLCEEQDYLQDKRNRLIRHHAAMALHNGVDGSTILRFIDIYLENDKERNLFFVSYANAAYDQGMNDADSYEENYPYDNDMSQY